MSSLKPTNEKEVSKVKKLAVKKSKSKAFKAFLGIE